MAKNLLFRFHVAAMLLALATGTRAQSVDDTAPKSEPSVPVYTTTPEPLEFIPNAFSDVPHMLVNINPVDHWRDYLGLALVSGVLIHYDQDILDGSQRLARRIHLISDHDQGGKSRVAWTTKVSGIDADIRLPDGPNSYMYFIGDGLTSLGIVSGLAGYGIYRADARALHTASQVAETIALTGMFVITGKFTAGRESPTKATRPGGAWHPVPGITNYLRAISSHDAFPSGHVATVMATVTTIHLNYPEKAWIMPAGYTAMGLLMFAMMNNGVHWAGDYPVGMAIGYVAAKTVVGRRQPQSGAEARANAHRDWGANASRDVEWAPFYIPGGAGIVAKIAI